MRYYRALVLLAYVWAVTNCAYVYLILKGARAFRVEAALWIFFALLAPLAFKRSSESRPVELPLVGNMIVLLAALGLWLSVMLPRIGYSYLSDDFAFLGMYHSVRDLLRTTEFFRPAFATLFWILSALGHQSSVPFHLASITLHIASTAVVYVLSKRLTNSHTVSTFCTATFVINPLQLEATLWIAGLQELLWVLFALLALAFYTRRRFLTAADVALTTIFVSSALLSKETAVCLVLLIPAVDCFIYRFDRGRVLWTGYATFAVVGILYIAARSQTAITHTDFLVAPSQYFIKQLVDLPYAMFAQPWNSTVVSPPMIVPAISSIVIVTLALLRVEEGAARLLLVGCASIFITTIPVYSFFYVGRDLEGARYLYGASVGWSLIAAQLLIGLRSRVLMVSVLAALLIGSFGALRSNVRPWDAANQVATEMGQAISRGADPLQQVKAFAASQMLPFKWTADGRPDSVAGVTVFRNGYQEFCRLAKK